MKKTHTTMPLGAIVAIAAVALAVPAQAKQSQSNPGRGHSEANPLGQAPAGDSQAANGPHAASPTTGDPAGHTAPATDAAPTCANPAASQVFAQFGDRKNYFLAPDGGFENGADGWTLAGSSVVDGSESFGLGGVAGSKSLSLPAGSSATSPAICLAKGHPGFRFVAKKSAGARKARLRVEVLYVNGKGKPSRVAGKLRAGSEWHPTKKLAFALGRAFAKHASTGDVSLRFTPVGAADWQIDGVYVDPRARR